MKPSAIDEYRHLQVTFKKCKPRMFKFNFDLENQGDTTSEDDVDQYVPAIKARRRVDIGVSTELSADGNQTGMSLRGLWAVSILDMIAPLLALSGANLCVLFPHVFQVQTGNLEKAKYLAMLLACLLQFTMGATLLLKLVKKIFSNCPLSKGLVGYHVLSALVAGLHTFVLLSPLLFRSTDTGYKANWIMIQAAIFVCFRVQIYVAVQKARRNSANLE